MLGFIILEISPLLPHPHVENKRPLRHVGHPLYPKNHVHTTAKIVETGRPQYCPHGDRPACFKGVYEANELDRDRAEETWQSAIPEPQSLTLARGSSILMSDYE